MALQEEIIQRLGVQAEIDVDEEIRKSIDFIKDYLKAHRFLKSAVLGISGGQDSTLVGRLAQIAMEELRQETGEAYRFIAVTLPYGQQADQEDVDDALDFIQPDRHLAINIKESVDALEQQFERESLPLSDFNKGNIKARIRMVAQYAVAGEEAGVVLGTDHAAEAVTGFYTKFGDGAADLMPIYRLNKRQGRAMLEALGSPAHLFEKTPTADLEDDRPLQADEDALGVSYEAIDDYLEGKRVDPLDKETIERLYRISEHKRRMPITIFDDFWKD